MQTRALHHFTILTDDVEKTAEFYRDVIGLTDGFAPNVSTRVIWLYCGDVPVLHIVKRTPAAERGTGRLDHVAFSCSGYAEFKAMLTERGINMTEQQLLDVGVRQIFVESPEGIWVELIFPIEEYRQAMALEGAEA